INYCQIDDNSIRAGCLVRNTLADKFDVGEGAGLFESPEEFQFGFIACRSHAQFDFNAATLLHGLDAHNTYAARQDFLQIHEHLRPTEAASIDDGIQKSGALIEIRVIQAAQETLDLASCLLVSQQIRAGSLCTGP